MKKLIILAALLGVGLGRSFAFPSLQSQAATAPKACQDLATVVSSVEKDLSGTVATVKKESLDDFVRQFHQQVVGSRLSTCLIMTNQLLDCLDKAAKDPATAKTDVDSIKTSQDAYTKLKNTLQQYAQTLKNVKDPKTAKSDVENFDFSH
ncbi:MAG: hypothetical protein ACRD18_11020 [Terriglobia bacterium]